MIPNKGDLINIEGQTYRVLKINGSQAFLLAMTNARQIKYFQTQDNIIIDNHEGVNYNESYLDDYMQVWFEQQSPEMQAAIIPQHITQSMYDWVPTNRNCELDGWGLYMFEEDIISGYAYSCRKYGSIDVGTRNVFALDVDDVIEYLDGNFTPQAINEMFFNKKSYVRNNVWLRACIRNAHMSSPASTNMAACATGLYGTIGRDDESFDFGARPSFVIDLNKIDWELIKSEVHS